MDNSIIPILAGFVIGFLIGLTGMGGGALMTPFLILWLKLDPVLAVGTDLMFAAFTKFVGGFHHWRADHVPGRSVLWLSVGSLPATVFAGRFVLHQAAESVLITSVLPRLLGAVLIVVAGVVIARLLGYLPARVVANGAPPPRPAVLIAIGALGGLLVGLTSVGGGTVILALLLLFYALPLPQLVGIDVVHGALLTATAALTYAHGGQTQWSTVGLLLIGSLPGVSLGARAIDRVNLRLVRAVVALLILVAAAELLRG